MHPLVVFLIGCLVLVIFVVVVIAVLDILAAKLQWDASIVKILRLIIGLVVLLIFIYLLLSLLGIAAPIDFGLRPNGR